MAFVIFLVKEQMWEAAGPSSAAHGYVLEQKSQPFFER